MANFMFYSYIFHNKKNSKQRKMREQQELLWRSYPPVLSTDRTRTRECNERARTNDTDPRGVFSVWRENRKWLRTARGGGSRDLDKRTGGPSSLGGCCPGETHREEGAGGKPGTREHDGLREASTTWWQQAWETAGVVTISLMRWHTALCPLEWPTASGNNGAGKTIIQNATLGEGPHQESYSWARPGFYVFLVASVCVLLQFLTVEKTTAKPKIPQVLCCFHIILHSEHFQRLPYVDTHYVEVVDVPQDHLLYVNISRVHVRGTMWKHVTIYTQS